MKIKNAKSGFTLAEVLITLAIIGVVSALTIPAIVHKIKNRELYTRFMTAYNTFNDVYLQLKMEGLVDVVDQSNVKLMDEMFSRLRYTKKCNTGDKCYTKTYGYKIFYNSSSPHEAFNIYGNQVYSLQNGIDFVPEYALQYSEGSFYNAIRIRVDINGVDKEPNQENRDIFSFYIWPYQNSISFDYRSYTNNNANFLARREKLTFKNINDIKRDCTVTPGVLGYTCAARILMEKGINY